MAENVKFVHEIAFMTCGSSGTSLVVLHFDRLTLDVDSGEHENPAAD